VVAQPVVDAGVLSLFLGGLVLAAFWIGGDPRGGIQGLAVLAGVGLIFLLGSRSETLRGLGGPGRDERWLMIDVWATAFAGLVLITVLIGAWLVEIARGEDGSPYALLGAVAGIAYVLAVAYLRFRR